mgnify:CR=1 FL=1
MQHVTFEEVAHKYYNLQGEEYISATSLVSLFKQPFYQEYWSLYKALQRFVEKNQSISAWHKFKKEHKVLAIKEEVYLWKIIDNHLPTYRWHIQFIQNQILEEWNIEKNIACSKGTIFHLDREKEAYEKGEQRYGDTDIIQKTATSYSLSLDNLVDGYHPELLLYNHKYKIAGQADRVWITTENSVRYVDLDDWKGFSLDTPIPTKNGYKLMKDIMIGDLIFDGNGELTKVAHVSQIHYNPCYKITFDTNEQLICDHEHKWEIVKKHKGSKKAIEVELTTEELYNEHTKKDSILSIPCIALTLTQTNLPIDPYVLGVWLADGNRTVNTITNTTRGVWEEIKKRGYKISENLNRITGRAESRTIYGIRKHLVSLNLLSNKHIPESYLRASHEQRLDLLRGLMDGDGYLHRKRKRCSLQTTKKWQADSLFQLVTSLGFKATIFISHSGTGFGKTNITVYDVCFTPTENPFLSRNQDYFDVIKQPGKYSKARYIKSIEVVATVPTKCIGVESNTHTYLAGYGGIKTHNTNKKIKTDNSYDNMKYPVEHLPDCNYNHYRLQLSLYAWMLEQQGYVVRNLQFTHCIDLQTRVPYKFTYLKEEVEALIYHYTWEQF